jgi:hypothetical protein
MYEAMVIWETLPLEAHGAPVRDYAGTWRAADKIVCSTTLQAVSSVRTPRS